MDSQMNDMTPYALASHWRTQAKRCRELQAWHQEAVNGKRPMMMGVTATDCAVLVIKNRVMAESLESCAEEMLRRLKT